MKTKLLTLMLGLLTITMSAQQFGAVNAQLSTAGADGLQDAYDPAVAYSTAQSKYLAVWDADDTDLGCLSGEKEIVGIFYKADGTPDGPKFRISTVQGIGTDAGFDADNVSIAYNETSDSFLVVFVSDTSTAGEKEVYGVIVNADGTSSLPVAPFRLSDMGLDGDTATDVNGYIGIACNETDDEYLVTWRGIDVAGEYEIYGQIVSAAGAEVGTDITLTNTPGIIGDNRPDVAWNSTDNEYMVVFANAKFTGISGQNDVHGQRISPAGVLVGTSSFRISNQTDVSTTFDGQLARVAYNPTANNYLVTFQGDDLANPGADEVWGQLIQADGTEIGADFRISTAGVDDANTALDASFSDVVWLPGISTYTVFWAADHNAANDFEIYYQNVSATGALVGVTVEATLTNAVATAVARDVRIAGDGDQKVMFVYEATGEDIYGNTALAYNEWEIYGNFWDIGGTMSTNNAILNTNFNVYPNPNNGQFSVSYKGDSALEKLSVFDITGRMVQSIDLQNANSETINVNLEGVSQGMYVLQIYTKNASVTKKIVIR